MARRMRDYLRKLNWSGFSVMVFLGALAAAANKSVNTVGQWVCLMVLVVLISMWFLIEVRDE